MTYDPVLTPFAVTRFSPMRFDEVHEASETELDLLLEAARRAPSAGNSQPWAFIVGRHGDQTHRRLVSQLARSSSAWAPSASILVANLDVHLHPNPDPLHPAIPPRSRGRIGGGSRPGCAVEAELLATDSLESRGITHKPLTVSAACLQDVKIKRRR